MLYVGSVSQAFDSISGPLRSETRYYYSFGVAFRLCIGAFMLSEFSGVFAIYLFLAELRHRHNTAKVTQKLDGYRFASTKKSSSTEALSPSRIHTATSSIAQISLNENCCLEKTQSKEIRVSPLSQSQKNHVSANHYGVNNTCRVKVISYRKEAFRQPTSHSLESLDRERVPANKRQEPGPASMGNLRIIRGTPRGNARSVLNIRAEEEVPDIVWRSKSGSRGSKQMLYSCRECEELLQQDRSQRNLNSMSLRSSRTPPRCQRPVLTSSISSTSSASSTSREYTMSDSSSRQEGFETESNLSEKLCYDGSSRRASRTRFRGHSKRGFQQGSSNEVSAFFKSGNVSNSESEMKSITFADTCRCPSSSIKNNGLCNLNTDSFSSIHVPMSSERVFIGEVDNQTHNPTKKRARHKQKITSV